jgi:hypothetical protein
MARLQPLIEEDTFKLPFRKDDKFILYPNSKFNETQETGPAFLTILQGSNATELQYIAKAYERAFEEKPPRGYMSSTVDIPMEPFYPYIELNTRTFTDENHPTAHYGDVHEEFHIDYALYVDKEGFISTDVKANSKRAMVLAINILAIAQEKMEQTRVITPEEEKELELARQFIEAE